MVLVSTFAYKNILKCVSERLFVGPRVIFISLLSPIVDNTPQVAQMLRQGPTAPEYSRTAFGDMKMPEPIMVPTIRQTPLNRPT